MENLRVLIIPWLNEKRTHHDKKNVHISSRINDIEQFMTALPAEVTLNNNTNYYN